MKFVLAICLFASAVYAQQEIPPRPNVRELPADVLRDFPGGCFASTACRMFQVGQSWPLKPFCGRSTCLRGPNGLVEKIEDCGPKPKDSPGCRLMNQADLEKDYPVCCPRYICQAGAQLLYPTAQELQAAAQQNQQTAVQATQQG